MTNTTSLEDLIRSIVSAICRDTDEPTIERTSEDRYTVEVNGRDQGRMIGKGGAVIASLQAIVYYAGINSNGRPAMLRLLEPRSKSEKRHWVFTPNPHWNRGTMEDLIEKITAACFIQPKFHMRPAGSSNATVTIIVDEVTLSKMRYPDIANAISTIIRCAGMADGVVIDTFIEPEK